MTPCWIPRSVFLLLLAFVSTGCTNPHRQVPGTDIPKVPQLELSKIQTTEGSKSQMTKGEVLFVGPIYDALERIRWSTENFEHSGWTLESITGTPEKATGIFYKNSKDDTAKMQRIATLSVTANRRKGTALVEFSTRPQPADKSPASDEESGKRPATEVDPSQSSESAPASKS